MPPSKTKKKQTRLAFASAATPTSPEESSRYSTLTYDNPILGNSRPKKKSSVKRVAPPKLSETERVSSKSNNTNDLSIQDLLGNQTSDEHIVPASQKKKQHAPPLNIEVTINKKPQKPEQLPKMKMISSRKQPQQVLRFPQKDTGSKEGSEELSRPRRALKRKAISSPIALSDSDEPVAASATKRRKSARSGGSSSSPLILTDEDEDENDIVAPSTAKRRRARPTVMLSDVDDSDEPVLSSPTKRVRRGNNTEDPQTPRTPRHTSKQAKLDIEEDLEDLQDSVVKKSRTRGRNVESARDKRLKQLDVLRRRRAGVKEESEEEEEDEEESDDPEVEEIKNPRSNTTPSGQGLWRHHDDDSDVESTIDPNEDLDRYEDDFVLEDEKDDLGVPTEEIPFEFTRHAYKQPRQYFQDVIGWMVQNKLNPAFPRSDAMYEMAFMKLEDEVKGRAGSQLISSVWTPAFVYSLQARPHLDVCAFPTDENHPCDACRRSGHPASADLRFNGKAYSLQTLEPLNDDDDDDSDASDESKKDDDGQDRDRNGHVIPPETVHFYLGRQCRGRAVLAHTLTHWRFHLNEWVIDHLERMGHMKDDEVLRRENLSVKRRTRNANEVLDKMVKTGEVDKLWRDFHLNLKSAREKESIYE